MTVLFFLFHFLFSGVTGTLSPASSPVNDKTIVIKKTSDFEVTGDGSNKNWSLTDWVEIPQRTATGEKYNTRVKILYSGQGMYFLYSCADKMLTATMEADLLHLWDEDVVEVFIQPDTTETAYFEYELSPLNYELPIMIYNKKGRLNSWQPFSYEGSRKTRHATKVEGGERKSLATVKSWTAEFFVPFILLEPVMEKNPSTGDIWKGNIYRIDYDRKQTLFSWQATSGNFHEPDKFGRFLFE